MLTLALTRAIENVRRRSLVYAEYAKPIDTASADLSKYEEAVEYVTEAISQITESRNEVQTLLQQIASEIGTARKSNKAALKKELDDALEAANFKMIDSESDGLLISLGTIKAQIKGKIRSLQRIEANEILSAPSRMSDNILAGYASRMDLQNLGQMPGSVLDPLQPLLNGPVAQSTPMPITNSRRNSVLSNHHFRPISPQSSASSRSQSFFIESDEAEAPVRPPRSSDSFRSCSAKTHEENIQNLEAQKAQNLPAVHQAARFTPFVPDSPIASENEGPIRRVYSTRAPKIKIPEFDGNRLKFSEFWSVFNLVVHDNPELTEAEKMIHLKNSLKGSAALVIEGIQLVPQNYSWMISALKKKYERTAHNRQQIIAELNGLPACHSDPEDCAEHLQKVRALMNRMRSTGADVGKAIDGTWLTIVASKFPQSLLEQVHSKMRHVEDCNVEDFLDQLEEIIEDKRYAKAAVEATNNFMATQNDSKPTSPSPYSNRNGFKTELCTLCEKGTHSPCECRTISNPEERFQTIRDRKLCLVCFQNHPTRYCKVHKKCLKCSYRHHESICSQAQALFNRPDSRYSAQPISEHKQIMNHRIQPNVGISENEVQMTPVLHNGASNRQLVLMTAEASVSNSASGDSEKVVVFFDSGSMISLIDDELSKRLKLQPKRTEETEITGISGMQEKFTSNVVEVQFNTPYGSRIFANLKTKGGLTKEFGAATLGIDDLQFLEDCNIILSNPRKAGQKQKPAILIGLDLFQYFVRDQKHERLPCGLYIARTILGCCAWGAGTVTAPSKDPEPRMKQTAASFSAILEDDGQNFQHNSEFCAWNQWSPLPVPTAFSATALDEKQKRAQHKNFAPRISGVHRKPLEMVPKYANRQSDESTKRVWHALCRQSMQSKEAQLIAPDSKLSPRIMYSSCASGEPIVAENTTISTTRSQHLPQSSSTRDPAKSSQPFKQSTSTTFTKYCRFPLVVKSRRRRRRPPKDRPVSN